MAGDAQATAQFYATARGAVACRLLRERLVRVWPSLAGLSVLGLGYAGPYLRSWSAEAGRCIAAVPMRARAGSAAGSGAGPAWSGAMTCATDEGALPFHDLCFDRVLLVHGLETADNTRALLREVWRVLKDDGRLLAVTPNRMGFWAHAETTPFGTGQPYSPGQIGRVLAGSLFRIERRDTALHMPPLRLRLALRSARAIEAGGRRLLPQLAGVAITEAVKDVYAALPLKEGRRRMVMSRAA